MPLWKVFGQEKVHPSVLESLRHLRNRHPDDTTEMQIPLSKSLPGGSGKVTRKFPLVHPYDKPGEQRFQSAHVELEVTASVRDSKDAARRCISSELQGCGPLTALFSSQRGLWYDAKLGEQRFRADRVSSFVEFTLDTLTFPEDDPPDSSKAYQYYVEAKCGGVCVVSQPLHRPKPMWVHLMPMDPKNIVYQDQRVFVPVPPCSWLQDKDAPVVEVAVMRCASESAPGLSFRELMSANGRPRQTGPSSEKVYHARISLQDMLLDQVRNKFPLLLSKHHQKVSEAKPAYLQHGQGEDAATLTVDISLRDRDFVLMHMARAKAAICVGDNAMIVCEEMLTYPKDEIEFRRRCFPGSFESRSRKGGGGGGRGWSAELRDPWMSHEYVISGLESLDKQHTYKPRNMALNCEDVIPYKFLLPQSEVEFLKQKKPGVFWRVMDDLVEMKGKDVKHDVSKDTPRTPRAKLLQTVVDHLTHTVKQVPVTVLATYANQTCDVELNAQFAAEWEQNPDRQYTIPGSVVVKEYADLSAGHVASTPVGSGDVGMRRKRRIVLK